MLHIDSKLPHVRELILVEEDEDRRPTMPARRSLFWMGEIFSAFRKRAVFLLFFALPVALSGTYYLVLAAPMYVSEAKFIVRTSAATPRLGSLNGGIGQVTTLIRANDDTQTVNAYITSRDALRRLVKEDDLLAILGRNEADFLARFPRFWSAGDMETLYERLPEFIESTFDGETGVATLRVRAFRAQDALVIADALLNDAEELVNKLSTRAHNDAIAFAEEVVKRSEARVKTTQERIAAFRNKEAVFDPTRQAVAGVELIGKLTAEIADLKAVLRELQINSPESPRVEATHSRIEALEQQVVEQRRLIVGGGNSLAPKLAEYEILTLDRELATKSFLSALVSLENAREEGDRKQLYLERIVAPNLPDQSRYPFRLYQILITVVLAFSSYLIVSTLIATALEHEI